MTTTFPFSTRAPSRRILTLVALALATFALAADETDATSFRQRYTLDPARAKRNAALVAKDLAEARQPGAALALYTVPAMSATKRMPDAYPEDGKAFAPLSFIASRGEFEPASFLLYPTKDQPDPATISVTDLRGKAGTIPASAIDLRVVKPWFQSGSAWYGYFADATTRTLVPELILHDENLVKVDDKTRDNYVRYENADGSRRYAWMSARFEVTDYNFANQANQGLIRDADTLRPVALNAGEFKQILATVRVPADARPGIYKGELSVRAKGGAVLAKLPVRLRVLPFDLPDPKTCYNPDKGFYLCLYGTGSRNPKILQDLSDHNAKTPMGFPGLDPMHPDGLVEDIRLARDAGLSLRPVFFGAPGVGLAIWHRQPTGTDLAKLENLRNVISKTRDLALRHLGHTDFYSYGIDEAGPDGIRAERRAWTIAHEAGGKVGVSAYPYKDLLYTLDFMIRPGMPAESREEQVAAFHASHPDGLCGWYANPHTGPENPDYFRRVHGLTAWKAGYDVASNYCWWRNNWNDLAVPFEPNLRSIVAVYGAADTVIDTLAWEGIREGLDDVRYATLAKQLALEAGASGDGALALRGRRVLAFLAYWDGYRDDPDAFRAECVNHILSLNAAFEARRAMP